MVVMFLFLAVLCPAPVLPGDSVAPAQALPEQEVVMSTDKSCYGQGEPVNITATGHGYVPSIGDYPKVFWAVTNESGGAVFLTMNSLTVVAEFNGTFNGTWNQTFRQLIGGRLVFGPQVPYGRYTIWFFSPPWSWYPSGWHPTNITIEPGCGRQLVADAGLDQTVNEGEIVRFQAADATKVVGTVFPSGPNQRINDFTYDYGGGGGVVTSAGIAPNGTTYISWAGHDSEPRTTINFDKAPKGGAFGTDVLIDDAPPLRYVAFPDIAVGPGGRIHAVWSHTTGSVDKSLWYSFSDDGKNFSPSMILGDAGEDFATAVAAGEDDSVHAVWGYKTVHYCSSLDNGTSWGPPFVLSTGGFPDIAASLNNQVYVVWQSALWKIFFSRSEPNGTFMPPVMIGDPGPDTLQAYPSISLGPTGEVFIVWWESSANEPRRRIVFMKSIDGGASFEAPRFVRIIQSDPYMIGRFSNVEVTPFGSEGVAVAWIELMGYPFENNFEVWASVSLDKGDTFGPPGRIDDDTTLAQKIHITIAGNPHGDLFAAWNDARLSPYGMLLKDDVFGVWLGVKSENATVTYSWDLDSRIDTDGDGNFTNDVDATGQTPTHVFGDNGIYIVTLKVTDGSGLCAIDTMNVTVLNLSPSITGAECAVEHGAAQAWIRIAGEKWHDVRATLYENGAEIGNVTMVRHAGSPNVQEALLGTVDGGASYVAVLRYTPDDNPVNGQRYGATPGWIILRSRDGSEKWNHHTFNVRHPDTWNWTVANLESYVAATEITCVAAATDPGSDDLTFTWDWGDGSPATATTYYNDGVRQDPHPSPGGTFPFTVTDVQIHAYITAGTHAVTLTVLDDDGGSTTLALNPLVSPAKSLLTRYDIGNRHIPLQEEACTPASRLLQARDSPPLDPSPPSGG